MEFIEKIKSSTEYISDKFIRNSTGSYYTHRVIADHLIKALISTISLEDRDTNPTITVVDPFAGDGRLIEWLINSWTNLHLPRIMWEISLWDINPSSLLLAEDKMQALIKKGISLNYSISVSDSFKLHRKNLKKFDLVITNPPWELLKPDNRELEEFSSEIRKGYINSLREYDSYLTSEFPKSQPKNKFAGWGTNLSRVGLELSHVICKDKGIVAIVLPASFFADDQSYRLRSKILKENKLLDIAYFPAEAKLFDKADVNSATFIYKKAIISTSNLNVSVYNKKREIIRSEVINPYSNLFFATNNVIPITLNSQSISILNKIATLKTTWEDLECLSQNGLWAGREIDETNKETWLCEEGSGPKFIKGSMIDRYKIVVTPSCYICKDNWTPPVSCQYERVAWRDIARSTQKRRLIATIIPENTIAGNSLNVAYFKNGNQKALRILLAIMNSFCFEFQLRCFLATGHISLSSIRKVYLPPIERLTSFSDLIDLIEQLLHGVKEIQPKIEAFIAKKAYRLTTDEFKTVLQTFEKITEEEKKTILLEYIKLED